MWIGNCLATLQGLAIVGMLVQSACAGGGGTGGAGNTVAVTTPAQSVSVTLVGVPAAVASGASVTVSAQVQGATSTAVTWTVDGMANGNASVGTISGTGNTATYTAPASAGNHVLAAVSVADPSVSGTAQVTVLASAGPVISAVTASSITQTSALISWTLNEVGTGQVLYGLTTAYGSMTTPELSFNYSAHAQNVTGLSAGTLYHYCVKSADQAGNLSTSGDYTFTTASATSSNPPASSITSVSVNPTTFTLNPSAQFSFAASVAGTGTFSYGVTWSCLRGTITSGGLYTAPSAAGSDTVTATSVQDGTKAGTATIAINGIASTPLQPYGSALACTSLANTVIDGGATSAYAGDYRFASPTTSSLTSLRLYFETGSGYAAGTYGTMRMIICPDDGSANHLPVPGTVLFTTDIPGATLGTHFVPVTISPAVSMTAGTLYHAYFVNVDPSPSVNFISLDMMYQSAEPTVAQPFSNGSYTNWAHLIQSSNGGAWTVRKGFTPTLELHYSNGIVYGNGYMEVEITSGTVNVSGANQVREVFTVSSTSGGTRTVTGVRASFAGTGTPVVRLETGAGVLIYTGAMVSDPIYSGYHFYSYDFPASVILTQGSTYHLIFSAASGSLQTWGIRKGSLSYGFAYQTCFGDGYGEISSNSGSTWTDLYPFDSGETDLQFVFY